VESERGRIAMQFIQLTDEAGREVWVNLEAVCYVQPSWYENGKPTKLDIILSSGLVVLNDPAEIERLKGILSLIAGDPSARVDRFRALKPIAERREEEPEQPSETETAILGAFRDEGVIYPVDWGELGAETFVGVDLGTPHEWRNYIPNHLRHTWRNLSEEARWLAYLFAERQARGEKWE
jgi:hypothetical protein